MMDTDERLREILSMETIAVVGCSSTPGKDAHEVPRYMQRHGYDVVPVNPNAETVLGRPAYDTLSSVEEEIEIVDVFRPGEEVAGIVQDVLARDDVAVVWTQLGIRDDGATERIEASGRTMVQDRCLKVEHGRLIR
jgi:predicted CoA-binding protein